MNVNRPKPATGPAHPPRAPLARERTGVPLFRPAALQAARQPLHGPVMIAMPPSAAISAVVSIVALILLCLAAFIVEVPQRTAAVGVLMPPEGFLKIVAADGGQVVQVGVREGEDVTSGQTLLSIGSDRGAVEGRRVSVSQLRSLESEARLLEDAILERQGMQRGRVDAVDKQLGNLRVRMQLIDRETGIQRSRMRLLRSRFERLQQLAVSGDVSAVQLDDGQLALLQAEAAAAVLEQQAARAIADRDQLKRARASLVEEGRVQQIEFAIAREQLARQMAALEAEVSRDLLAPLDGVVARITVRPGQAVRAGQTLMTLHRREAPLEAWLYLSSANAGLLEEGQQVELSLDAWPRQVFGTRSATIASVSHIALLPSELDVPLAIAGPVFEVRATLDEQDIRAHGKKWPLAAGTSLRADIVQRRYRLYQWLLRSHPGDGASRTLIDG